MPGRAGAVVSVPGVGPVVAASAGRAAWGRVSSAVAAAWAAAVRAAEGRGSVWESASVSGWVWAGVGVSEWA
ncbi:hypothetical protein GCM10017776_08830 [Streptomyces griseoluteus]|nr:hypothetical protein GCM10017776_08830 [Streptomyces griseoluteus]